MNDKLRQQHFKTNAPVDTDDFLNKLSASARSMNIM